MRISTWNLKRLKHKAKMDEIVRSCESAAADIFVLTETDWQIELSFTNCLRMERLHGLDEYFYGKGENRASIYTNYKCAAIHETYDRFTSVCAELETEKGSLVVYATIIGVYGNRHNSFMSALQTQVEDVKRLTKMVGKPICVIGDYNLSFADNYYFTKEGRNLLLDTFADMQIELLTEKTKECIEHIAVSKGFLDGCGRVQIEEWNHDKSLSDHKGISAEILW